jgi:transposase
MFDWWHRGRDGTLAHTSFRPDMPRSRQAVERRLEAGHISEVPKAAGMWREILRLCQALWTFVRHPKVEPTNNRAEVRSVDQKPSLTLGRLVPR